MRITEVQIKLAWGKVLAYASIVIDNSIRIGEIKLIDRGEDGILVAMPQRKITDLCRQCRLKTPLTGDYCECCGAKQPPQSARLLALNRPRLFADIIFPISQDARDLIEQAVLTEYHKEKQNAEFGAAKQAG